MMKTQTDAGLVREAIEELPWRSALPADGMPAHQYVILGRCPAEAWDILDTEIREHPDSYDAYFRGYPWPMHYWEFDGYRFWRTSAKGPTHMLNRCTLESVEPPRRVDEGAVAGQDLERSTLGARRHSLATRLRPGAWARPLPRHGLRRLAGPSGRVPVHGLRHQLLAVRTDPPLPPLRRRSDT